MLATGTALVGHAAVYGPDGRARPGARTAHRYPYVGLLLVPGERSFAGTATLVAPDRILTTAHTLFDAEGRARLDFERLRLRLGADLGKAPWVELAVRRVVAVGAARVYEPRNEHLDWAVLEVESVPEAPEPARLVPAGPADAEEGRRVELVAYHRDVGGGLVRVTSDCALLPVDADAPLPREGLSRSAYLAHDCDAAPMSSGAGLFAWIDGRPHLAALHVGKVGPARAARADVGRGRFNVALRLGHELRAALVAGRSPDGEPSRRR